MTKAEINVCEINSTLKNYPKIHSIFGDKDIERVEDIYRYPYKKQGCNEPEFNIYGVLNSPNVIWKTWLLDRFECLAKKLSGVYSDEQIRSGLQNDPFSFKSELEFAEFCLNSGIEIIEINPKLNTGKKMDLLIKLRSQQVFVEVITPRIKLKMLTQKAGCFSISGEIENNIVSEFKHHEIQQNELKHPFIIVIDSSYGRIDFINILGTINEFNANHPKLSELLSGIVLMQGRMYSFMLQKEVGGGMTYFENQNSKYIIAKAVINSYFISSSPSIS